MEAKQINAQLGGSVVLLSAWMQRGRRRRGTKRERRESGRERDKHKEKREDGGCSLSSLWSFSMPMNGWIIGRQFRTSHGGGGRGREMRHGERKIKGVCCSSSVIICFIPHIVRMLATINPPRCKDGWMGSRNEALFEKHGMMAWTNQNTHCSHHCCGNLQMQ